MITVDVGGCSYCGGCISVCPVGALYLAGTRLRVDHSCIACGDCVQACPVGALALSETAGRQHAPPELGSHYDVVVVGAGPAGSIAAWTAARAGLSVLLLEKRQEIGSPVRCAEGVPSEALHEFIEPDPRWISSTIGLAQIVARADGEVVETWRGMGGSGYVLERRIFDRTLAEQAVQSGAEVRVKAAVTGLLREDGAVCGVDFEWHGRRYRVRSDVVIGADGVEAQTGAWAGLLAHLPLRDTMVCAQYLLAGVDWDPACTGYWIDDSVAPGGYAWVFPKGEGRANVGLGVQADLAHETALTYLDRFVEAERNLAASSPVTLVTGNVPVSLPAGQLVTDGLILAGDAARLVDPLTGGGIIHAMTAGRLAAQVAAKALEEGDSSRAGLAAYQDKINEVLGKSLARNYRLRQRFPPSERASRGFLRVFALAAGGK